MTIDVVDSVRIVSDGGAKMPIVYIVSGIRCALQDMTIAAHGGDWVAYRAAYSQVTALLGEMSKWDGAKERIQANDT